MASTFSPSLRIELIGAGEQSGAWNNTTNTNLGFLVEQAISGVETVSIGSSTDYTLTTADGAADQARNMVVNITGTPGGAFNVICPTVEKLYVVRNSVTGSHTMTFKTSSGSGITIPNGRTTLVYCDGTNVLSGLNELPTGSTVNGSVISTTTGEETLTNKTLTAPEFADNGFIADLSGNRMLSFDTLASGVLTDSTSLSVSNGPANLTVTGASGTGTTATIIYTAGTSTQIPVGASVTVANITPSGYNGTYTVTSSAAGSISYANTTTAAWSSGGTIAVAPVIAATGTGSNIDINIIPKGTGVVRASGVEVVTTTGTQTLTNKTISGLATDLAVADGGTGASTAADARTNLDVGQAGVLTGINTQTTTPYTLVLADRGDLVDMSLSSANVVSIPTNSTAAFPVGTVINVISSGTGQTTISPAGGVTLNSYGGKTKLSGRYSMGTLIKKAENTWYLAGDLMG
jgi:hypothetical protein